MTGPRREVTAGTAGDGYLAAREPCTSWRPKPADYGQRPRCECGREKHQHITHRIPSPRAAAEETTA